MGEFIGDDNSVRPYDEVVTKIVDYAYDFDIQSPAAWLRAKTTLLDALGAAFEGLEKSAELKQLLGPTFPSPEKLANGFKVPGTSYQLDILKGTFDMGVMIRYLDHNDAFVGAEWGHPSGGQALPAYLATGILTSSALLQIIWVPFLRLLTFSHGKP